MSLELTREQAYNLQKHLYRSNIRSEIHPGRYSKEKEMEVLALVDEGLSNPAIHAKTGMSPDRINDLKKKTRRWGK